MYENKKAIKHYIEFAKNGLLDYEKKIVEKFLTQDMKIIDIGCGTGRTTKAISDFGLENII